MKKRKCLHLDKELSWTGNTTSGKYVFFNILQGLVSRRSQSVFSSRKLRVTFEPYDYSAVFHVFLKTEFPFTQEVSGVQQKFKSELYLCGHKTELQHCKSILTKPKNVNQITILRFR